MIYRIVFKRLIDIVFSFIAGLALLPLMLIISLLLRLKLGKPALFQQQRPGMNGKPFTLLKFRTMTNATDESGNLLPDKDRMHPLGTFLRKTSLDELPELYNVLKGDMSLIGPRPLLMEYLPLYNDQQKRRHEVRPGITGWAQINGRNNLSWNEKFDLDIWYVEHMSFLLDLKIITVTVLKVLRREGISKTGQATTEKFNGYN